jgi:uncharacterized damage-inducible protein DinB
MGTREELRAEIEATRDRFHALLDATPDDALTAPSDNPAWTIGEVLFHMSLAPRLMVADVGAIRHHPAMVGVVAGIIPQDAFDLWNRVYTREAGKRKDRAALAEAYDAATERILATLAGLAETDLARSATYPGWDPLLAGEVTLERLFHYVKDHFETHEAGLLDRIGSTAPRPRPGGSSAP